jgi:hypothetical protein
VISQPGLVFNFDPEHGYTGLLTGKKAVVIYTGGDCCIERSRLILTGGSSVERLWDQPEGLTGEPRDRSAYRSEGLLGYLAQEDLPSRSPGIARCNSPSATASASAGKAAVVAGPPAKAFSG